MKTDELISQLSKDLRPVRPAASAGRLVLGFSIWSMAMVAIGLMIFHVRPDVFVKISNPFYLMDLVIPFAVMDCASLLVGRMSIPGRDDTVNFLWATVVLLVSLMIFELARTVQITGADAIAGLDSAGLKCFLLVIIFAAIPTGFLAFISARRAPVRPLLVGLVIAIAGISAGQVGIALHCPIDNVVHIALWHFALPIAAGVGLGIFVLSRFIRW